ncbi:helix-turn-helix domain-containing protein [Paenibacillus sp. 1P07SE]|uniref:helix-turn-helix domain-containing protein n=1 Tax=Paenibacillus sp. 1P07SE TaxID=3132209 RepID=UPI0039A66593
MIRFFVPYVVYLLCALLVGWFMYAQTTDMIEKQMEETNMIVLEQSRTILDMRLQELGAIATQLEMNAKVSHFASIRHPYEGGNTFKIVEMRKQLYEYRVTNQFLLTYYLLFDLSDLAVNKTLSESLPSFYKHNVTYTDFTYQEWRQQMMGDFRQHQVLPASEVRMDGKVRSVLTYIHSLGLPPVPSGAAVILIDNQEVQHLLRGLELSHEGWAYIADESGQLISYISEGGDVMPALVELEGSEGVSKLEIGEREMMVTHTTSSYNGWQYVAVQPMHIVLEKVNYVKKITMIIAALFLAAGLAAAVVMAYRHEKPVRLLTLHHEALRRKVEERMPFLREAFVEHLLKGQFATETEIQVMAEHTGVKLRNDWNVVVLIQLRHEEGMANQKSLKQREVSRVWLRETIAVVFGEELCVHDIGDNIIAVILSGGLPLGSPLQDFVGEALKKVQEEMTEYFDLHPYIAVGTLQHSLQGISRSYEQAKFALNYNLWHLDNGIVWYDELPKERHKYYFPGDTEQRVLTFMKSGETDALKSLLEELRTENFVQRALTLRMQQLLISNMIGSLLKLPEIVHGEGVAGTERSLESFLEPVESLEESRIAFEKLAEMFLAVAEISAERKKQGNSALIEGIIVYVQEEYTDPEISLKSVSDRFRISESYLSRFFKEHIGLPFSEYVEKLRMERAKYLLLHTEMSVSDIVQESGYHSSNTFGRAFKRSYGLSATAFRNSEKC